MKRIFFLFIFALPLLSQPQTSLAPDCSFAASFTGTGSSASYDNRAQLSPNAHIPCAYWSLSYSADSTVTATTTINIEGAPGNGSTPGSFASLASSSVLPSAKLDTSGAHGYYPWINITVSAYNGSGTIRAVLNGWRANASSISSSSSSSGCPGTSATPCDVQGVTGTGSSATENPLLDGAKDSAGNKVPFILGTSPAALSLSSSGLTRIVTVASGTAQIRLTHISLSFASAVDFQLEYGTKVSTDCDTGATALTGVYKGILTIVLSFTLDPLLVPAGKDLCVNLGTGVVGGGLAKYANF
jgi:hypothetical protein